MAKISIFLIRCVPFEGHLISYNFTLKLHLPYLKLCAFNYPCITKANDRIMLGQYILLTRSLICSWSTLQQTFWFRKFLRNWICYDNKKDHIMHSTQTICVICELKKQPLAGVFCKENCFSLSPRKFLQIHHYGKCFL